LLSCTLTGYDNHDAEDKASQTISPAEMTYCVMQYASIKIIIASTLATVVPCYNSASEAAMRGKQRTLTLLASGKRHLKAWLACSTRLSGQGPAQAVAKGAEEPQSLGLDGMLCMVCWWHPS